MKLKANWNQILYHLNWYCWFLVLSCGTLPIWVYFRFMKLEGISVIPKWIVLLIPFGLFALRSYEKNRQKGNLPYLFSLTFILITGFFVLKNTPQFGNDYLWVYLYHALKKGIVGVIGIRFLFHSEANKNLPQDYIGDCRSDFAAAAVDYDHDPAVVLDFGFGSNRGNLHQQQEKRNTAKLKKQNSRKVVLSFCCFVHFTDKNMWKT